jgi:hypothetical protein
VSLILNAKGERVTNDRAGRVRTIGFGERLAAVLEIYRAAELT